MTKIAEKQHKLRGYLNKLDPQVFSVQRKMTITMREIGELDRELL